MSSTSQTPSIHSNQNCFGSLSALPVEVMEKVISSLSPQTLCILRQVGRGPRMLVDRLLWGIHSNSFGSNSLTISGFYVGGESQQTSPSPPPLSVSSSSTSSFVSSNSPSPSPSSSFLHLSSTTTSPSPSPASNRLVQSISFSISYPPSLSNYLVSPTLTRTIPTPSPTPAAVPTLIPSPLPPTAPKTSTSTSLSLGFTGDSGALMNGTGSSSFDYWKKQCEIEKWYTLDPRLDELCLEEEQPYFDFTWLSFLPDASGLCLLDHPPIFPPQPTVEELIGSPDSLRSSRLSSSTLPSHASTTRLSVPSTTLEDVVDLDFSQLMTILQKEMRLREHVPGPHFSDLFSILQQETCSRKYSRTSRSLLQSLLAGAAERERKWDQQLRSQLYRSALCFFSSRSLSSTAIPIPIYVPAQSTSSPSTSTTTTSPIFTSTPNDRSCSTEHPTTKDDDEIDFSVLERKSLNQAAAWRIMWAANMESRRGIKETITRLQSHFPSFTPLPMSDKAIDKAIEAAVICATLSVFRGGETYNSYSFSHEDESAGFSFPSRDEDFQQGGSKKRKRGMDEATWNLANAFNLDFHPLDYTSSNSSSDDSSPSSSSASSSSSFSSVNSESGWKLQLPEGLREFFRLCGGSLEVISNPKSFRTTLIENSSSIQVEMGNYNRKKKQEKGNGKKKCSSAPIQQLAEERGEEGRRRKNKKLKATKNENTSSTNSYKDESAYCHNSFASGLVEEASFESIPWLPCAPRVFLADIGYPHWLLILVDPLQGFYAVNCDATSTRFGCVALFEPEGKAAHLRYHRFEEFLAVFVEGITGPMYRGFYNRSYSLPLFDPIAVWHHCVQNVEHHAPFEMRLPDIRSQYKALVLSQSMTVNEFRNLHPWFDKQLILRSVASSSPSTSPFSKHSLSSPSSSSSSSTSSSSASRIQQKRLEDKELLLLNTHNGFLVRGREAIDEVFSRMAPCLETSHLLFTPCSSEEVEFTTLEGGSGAIVDFLIKGQRDEETETETDTEKQKRELNVLLNSEN